MTVIDDKVIKQSLQVMVDKVFKILPLYEENNTTLKAYVKSLVMELKGFVAIYGSVGITEYISIISTLEGLCEVIEDEENQPVVKREVFKIIKTIKKITDMLEGD